MVKPKILIFTVNAWSDIDGTYTFSTLFEDYGSELLANLCIRDQLPDSSVCSRYFRISESKIIRHYIHPSTKTGAEVYNTVQKGISVNEHKIRYAKHSAKRTYGKLLARELIWKFGSWRSIELDNFLDDFSPDIIIYAMEGYIHLNRIVRYSIKRTGAKSIGYFWDDNFTYNQYKNFGYKFYRYFQRKELKKCVQVTNEFWAITPKTKDEADKTFDITCTLITKPIINVQVPLLKQVKKPIRILYTGNLLIGRSYTLKIFIEALKKINSKEINYELEIYTQTSLGKEYIKDLSSKWCRFEESIPQDLVLQKQNDADILLFLEDITGPHNKAARLSFSTKITDYLSAGKCIFAIGDMDIAPMHYLKEENAAVTASNANEIYNSLVSLKENPSLIIEMQKNSYDCGIKNHSKQEISMRINNTIKNLIQ